jgi:hypothetical protein
MRAAYEAVSKNAGDRKNAPGRLGLKRDGAGSGTSRCLRQCGLTEVIPELAPYLGKMPLGSRPGLSIAGGVSPR